MDNKTLMQIIDNGGATLSKNGLQVNFLRGYQVSKKDCYQLKISEFKKILRSVNYLLAHIGGGEFVGVWVDAGVAYIDISEHIKSKKTALRVGRERKQISIFDWQNGNCIYC